MTTNSELRVGDNINTRKFYKGYRGELVSGNYNDRDTQHTGRVVYSLGNGTIQVADVQEFSGKIIDVSAPIPARQITKAGRSPYMNSYIQYWKPAN